MPGFRSKIELRGRGGHVIALPSELDPKATFGAVRARVLARVGELEYRTTLTRYDGVDYLGITKANLVAADLSEGDAVSVELVPDTAPRAVVVPPQLAAVLAGEPALQAFFDSLSFTHRREYADWIAAAKREDTRARRVEKAIEMLRTKVRHP